MSLDSLKTGYLISIYKCVDNQGIVLNNTSCLIVLGMISSRKKKMTTLLNSKTVKKNV